MIWLLVLCSLPAFSQVDVSAIRKFDEQLPQYGEYKESDDGSDSERMKRQHLPFIRKVSLERILSSGTQLAALPKGTYIRNLSDNTNYIVDRLMYVKVYKLEDEHGFKYVESKDGKSYFRVRSEYVESIKEVTELYEPPLKYTPAPTNIVKTEYDEKLSIPPELSFYTGVVTGNFMVDLFNDKKAISGTSNQFGLHFFTQWKLPVKAGAVFHYEKASYKLSDGSQINYTSPSFGPQFKTKEWDLLGQPLRFQTQFRVSPFAKATTDNLQYAFNSADLLVSVERPIKNRFGEFVLGLYGQSQWLNVKDRPENVQVAATNATNNSYGVSFAQVFE